MEIKGVAIIIGLSNQNKGNLYNKISENYLSAMFIRDDFFRVSWNATKIPASILL
jgi:hypothetical protein